METTHSNRPHRLWIALAGLSVAVAITACGGSSTPLTGGGATTATGNASPIALSRCMRTHGVPNFPDPVMGSGGEGFPGGLTETGDGSMSVDGVALSGPALRSAETACARYLTPKGLPPAPSQRQKHAALMFAQCMRRHGVPSFPDPTFSVGGPVKAGLGAGINIQSPAFQTAAKACGAVRGGGLRIRIPG